MWALLISQISKVKESTLYLIFMFIFVAVLMSLGAFATEYVLEFWLNYWLQKPVNVPLWACFLAAPFIGEIAIIAFVVTMLVSFCL